MEKAFITVLTTDSYLPGILVVSRSLKMTGTSIPLFTCVTSDVSASTFSVLRKAGIEIIQIEALSSGKNDSSGYSPPHWRNTFSKLQIFKLDQFDKLVYLDADLLICASLDHLFNKPHLSAVNAGGFVHKDWRDLNSGLMVIEPSHDTFRKIQSVLDGAMDELRSDQDVLHKSFPEWPTQSKLNLGHSYNIFDDYIEDAEKLLSYKLINNISDIARDKTSSVIKVIHFVSTKPWDLIGQSKDKLPVAFKLWFDVYESDGNASGI